MSNHQYFRHSIYESLPYLYMGAGVLVVVTLPNVWGLFSSLLLLSTGIWVLWQRRTYRKASHLREIARARSAAALTGRHDTGMALLAWKKEYECGHVTIDTQHRKLFEMGNALLNAILDEKPKLDVELLLDELIKDVTNHFRTEETLLARTNHLTTKHQDTHQSLLARCKDKAERYHNDALNVDDLFEFVARDLVSEHILTEDLKCLTASMG
jgi:hemerythrin-like metal-binding protein